MLATFRLETDIGHFLPGGDDDVEVRLAKELSLGELSRTSLLLIEAPDTDSAVRASMHFEKKLRNEPRVNEHLAFLEGGPSEGLEEALWELYQPRRFAFFAEDPTSAAASLTEASLREAAVHLKKQLALPLSTLVTRVAPEDPTLILPRLFKKLSGRGEGLQIVAPWNRMYVYSVRRQDVKERLHILASNGLRGEGPKAEEPRGHEDAAAHANGHPPRRGKHPQPPNHQH